MKVLLAEDNPDNQKIICFFLRQASLFVEVVDTGEKAIQAALKGDFDFILMDMQMPQMDGYTATRTLRQRGHLKPIIALTAHSRSSAEKKCLESGCDGFLSKPLDMEKIAQLLKKLVPDESQLAKAPTVVIHPMKPAQQVQIRKEIPEDLQRLQEAYINSLTNKVAELVAAAENNDRSLIAEASHRLRGSAGMYGLIDIAETACMVEDACREGRDLDLLSDLIQELRDLSNLLLGV
ncbi:response regulator [Telmatocola sphagniphila]|uniref:Response regulator n=1 Tax=Telmatocola sphagniphila TaxID=1123043 RepID=A0A8E6BB53_9BACT|nr:response regulator [Telmatocola sphagniphila]QVL33918.1 response regulator [Telmatocola sphagniphila]